MGFRSAVVALALAPLAWAGGPFFQRAEVVSMQMTDCMVPHHSVMAALSGAGNNQQDVCAEYILVSPTTIFRVQASKSAPLLLPSEDVNFRPGKGALKVRRDEDGDDFDVKVVCMQGRSSKQETCGPVDDTTIVTARRPR